MLAATFCSKHSNKMFITETPVQAHVVPALSPEIAPKSPDCHPEQKINKSKHYSRTKTVPNP